MKRFDLEEARRRFEAMARNAPPAPPPCLACDGTKLIQVPSDGVPRYSMCRACLPKPKPAGLPVALVGVTFETLSPTPGQRLAIDKARAFVESGRDLYLAGGVGVGKTVTAAAVAHAFCEATGAEALFVRWAKALHDLQPTGLSEDARRAFEGRLFAVPLLVIDDLGSERDRASDFSRRTTLMVYEERGDRGLRTVFTSNLGLDRLAAHQDDDRLVSRLVERADVVIVAGSDLRLKRPAEGTRLTTARFGNGVRKIGGRA